MRTRVALRGVSSRCAAAAEREVHRAGVGRTATGCGGSRAEMPQRLLLLLLLLLPPLIVEEPRGTLLA